MEEEKDREKVADGIMGALEEMYQERVAKEEHLADEEAGETEEEKVVAMLAESYEVDELYEAIERKLLEQEGGSVLLFFRTDKEGGHKTGIRYSGSAFECMGLCRMGMTSFDYVED